MLSVVIPAYNEADLIEETVRSWHDTVVARIPGAELLVVDDCSTDATGAVLVSLSARFPALRVVRPPRNGGHGRAVRLGFTEARQPFVFQTDSDQQHLPEEFWGFWDRRDEADFLLGVRRQRADGAARVVVSGTLRFLILLLWFVWISDANCPFKLMRREALNNVLRAVDPGAFIPMVLVSVLARVQGYRVLELEVTHLPRGGGTQSIAGIRSLLRASRTSFGNLIGQRVGRKAEGREVPVRRG